MKRYINTLVLSILATLLLAMPVYAKEPATPEITMNQAIQMALDHSADLKNAQTELDRSYEVRQFSSENLKFVPVGPATTDVTRAFYGLQQADLSWQMAKKSLQVKKDNVEMAVHQAYNTILQAQEKLKFSQLNVKNAEIKRNIAAASLRVGTIDKYTLVQAEASLSSAKSSLEADTKALDDAYQKFNQLVGLWPEDRPHLAETPMLKKLQVDILDAHVARILEESPSLWLAKEKVNLAKITLDTYNFSDPTRLEPYKAKEYDVDKAIISASDAQEQTKKLIRTLYYSVRQLEDKYVAVNEQVKVAEENLRVTKIKSANGMTTSSDVVEAETAVVKAHLQVLDIACQHDILVLAFLKPWAYSATDSAVSQ